MKAGVWFIVICKGDGCEETFIDAAGERISTKVFLFKHFFFLNTELSLCAFPNSYIKPDERMMEVQEKSDVTDANDCFALQVRHI